MADKAKSMLSQANLTDLRTKGYTVVPGVISPADCDKYIDKYKEWLQQFKGSALWQKWSKGIIRGYGTGFLESTWEVRLQAKKVFSELWKTEKLLTSFDTIAAGRPPEEGKEPFDDGSSHWLHLDQESKKDGLHAYQGGVYLEEACHDDWTLQVMENSHIMFEKFFRENPKAAEVSIEKKFFKLNKTQVKYFQQNGCKIVRVPVPKGGLVLWDSRLVHANAQPLEGRANPGRWRYVVFVSMTPAKWASQADMDLKRKAFKSMKMTNHWSSVGCTLMKEPCASKSYPRVKPAIASNTAVQKLAGVQPYDFDDGQPNGPPTPRITVPKRKLDLQAGEKNPPKLKTKKRKTRL